MLLTRPGLGQAAAPDTSALRFGGFAAGAPREEINAQLRRLGGQRLSCTRSRADSTVQECRGRYSDSTSRRGVELWISVIAERAAILTIKTEGALSQLERWRSDLVTRYGRVETRSQGAQRMMQWVRRGRMIRLTWRLDQAAPAVSVSLVDGRILDGWGRLRE